MRFENIRIVATVEVHKQDTGSFYSPKPRYETKRKEQPDEKDWFDWAVTDPCQAGCGGYVGSHGFTVAIVGYGDFENISKPLLGLNRREALSMLKDVGLRPLTHLETFHLASEEIVLKQLCLTMRPTYDPKKTPTRKNPHVDRYIVSPVSINVEFPFYYLFSIYGVRGREQFLRRSYHKIDERKGILFDYNWVASFNKKALAFPMVMGVIPESVNEKMMPAKKKLTFGAPTSGTNRQMPCPKCHEDSHIYVGSEGSYMGLQCVYCDTVYWEYCSE